MTQQIAPYRPIILFTFLMCSSMHLHLSSETKISHKISENDYPIGGCYAWTYKESLCVDLPNHTSWSTAVHSGRTWVSGLLNIVLIHPYKTYSESVGGVYSYCLPLISHELCPK